MPEWSRVPWDSRTFGVPAYEMRGFDRKSLERALRKPGHYTVKTDPRSPKKLLHEFGFYYCDTLLVPSCRKKDLAVFEDRKVSLAPAPLGDLLALSRGAFSYGRFHRDFAVDRGLAEARYARWLTRLHHEGKVTGFFYGKKLAGFIACDRGRLVLHALSRPFRGRGLAKYFWSAACRAYFKRGLPRLSSSVSAANTPALNLYASLGFRFREAADVYHRKVLA